jgi:hypothetical protein
MKLTVKDLLHRIEEERLRRALQGIKTEDKEVQAIRRALYGTGLHTIR